MKILRPIDDIITLLGLLCVGASIYALAWLFYGCAAKEPLIPFNVPIIEAACVTNPPDVSLTLLKGSIPVTCKETQHIIKRTNLFCILKNRSPVTRINVHKKLKSGSSAIRVIYYCSWKEEH